MDHAHIRNLPTDHYDALVSITPISCYNHFRRVWSYALNILHFISAIIYL